MDTPKSQSEVKSGTDRGFSYKVSVYFAIIGVHLFGLISQPIVANALTVTEAVNSLQTSTPGLPSVDNPKGNIGFILANIFYTSADGVKNGMLKPQYLDGVGTWTSSGANAYFTYTGSVGIGTNTPGQKLDVVGGSIRTSNQMVYQGLVVIISILSSVFEVFDKHYTVYLNLLHILP